MKIRNGFVSNSSSSSFIICSKTSILDDEARTNEFNKIIEMKNNEIKYYEEQLEKLKRKDLIGVYECRLKNAEQSKETYERLFKEGYSIIEWTVNDWSINSTMKLLDMLAIEYEILEM